MSKSAAIIGLPPVSAIGTLREEFWANLIAGKTDFRRIFALAWLPHCRRSLKSVS
jgi:hypothetical protein